MYIYIYVHLYCFRIVYLVDCIIYEHFLFATGSFMHIIICICIYIHIDMYTYKYYI